MIEREGKSEQDIISSKSASRVINRSLKRLKDFKVSRREALIWGGLSALGIASGGAIGLDTSREIKYRFGENSPFNAVRPPAPEEIRSKAEKYIGLRNQSNQLENDGKLTEANAMRQSEAYGETYLAALQKKQIEEELKRDLEQAAEVAAKESPSFLKNRAGKRVLYGLGSLVLTGFSASMLGWMRTESRLARERLKKSIEALRPEWLQTPPDAKEVAGFVEAIASLPPTGGKIPLTEKGNRGLLPPVFTAEQQIDGVINRRRNGEFGDHYIHQFSVQGRLPDRFKYAAIALILHSPHGKDWSKPWISNVWGTVAPLIHDGGNFDNHVNPRWRKVKGRTDFFQGSFIEVPKPATKDAQPRNLFDRLEEELATGEFNKLEEERIRRESTFYQRAALAMHAENGSAPTSIPEEVRQEAAGVWREFEDRMKYLLVKFDISGVGEVPWFLKKPRRIPGWYSFGKRYEADWPPIQQELMKLEEAKKQNPDLQRGVTWLLRDTTRKIDQIIGFPSQAQTEK